MKTKWITPLILIAFGLLILTAIPISAQDQKPADTGTAAAPPASPPVPPAPKSKPSDMLCFLLIGALMGTVGQVGRAITGIKKEMDAAAVTQKKWDEWFNTQQLVVSLILGAAAGLLASVLMLGAAMDKQFLLGCVAAGYSGSDFIEGIMTKNVPG